MKNRYTLVMIILLVLGLACVFLLASAGQQRLKAANVFGRNTAAQGALINAIPGYAETAIFASGCLTDVREHFSEVNGVFKAEAGYTGATGKTPASKDECFYKTGKTEAVRVVFDPNTINYGSLLQNFWELHNPASLKKQAGQCRVFVFYTNPNQDIAARDSLQKLIKSGRYSGNMAVVISQAGKFHTVEEYRKICLNKSPQGLSSADRTKRAGK